MAFHRDRVEKALQTCLEYLNKGQGSVDSILSSFPELADQLRPVLEAATWLQQRRYVLDPRPGYIASSRRRLMARLQRENAAELARMRSNRQDRLWGSISQRLIFQLALLIITVGSLLIGGSGVAFATQASLPGDTLYPLKIALEDTELAVTWKPEQMARLHIEFAEQRMVELQSLLLEGSYDGVPATVALFEGHVSQAVQAVNQIAGSQSSQAKRLANSLQQALMEHAGTVALLSQVAPEHVGQQVERTLVVSEQGVFAVQLWLDNPGLALITATPSLTPTPSSTPTAEMTASSVPSTTPTPSQTAAPEAAQAITTTPTPTSTGTPLATRILKATATATRKPKKSPVPVQATATERPTLPPATKTPVPPTKEPTREPTEVPYPAPL